MLRKPVVSNGILCSLVAGHLALGCAQGDALPLAGGGTLAPMSVDFGDVPLGGRVTQTVAVSNTTDLPLSFDVRAGPSTPPVFSLSSARVEVPSRSEAALDVIFQPADAVAYDGTFEFWVDDSLARSLAVRGRGQADVGCVEITPVVVNFGNVVVDTMATERLVLENVCESNATVILSSHLGVERCDFSNVGGPKFCWAADGFDVGDDGEFQLGAGRQAGLDINFTPTVIGTHERGILRVQDTEVNVDGFGVQRSLSCEPTRIDFGDTSPGGCRTETITCANMANLDATIVSWALVTLGGTPSSEDFETEPSSRRVLRPGESIDIDVTYCPSEFGNDFGMVAVQTDNRDQRLRDIFVPLTGTGGGPKLMFFPDGCLDFGLVSTSAPARRTLIITNLGTSAAAVTDIVVDTAQTGAFTAVGAAGTQLQPGEALAVTIEMLPTSAGTIQSELLIRTSDLDEPEKSVCLRGEGVVLGACDLEVRPAVLDFGEAVLGQSHRGVVEVRNIGAADCLLSTAELLPGADLAYELASVETRRFAAGAAASVAIDFLPRSAGSANGMLELSVSRPTSPFVQVPLSAVATADTLLIGPQSVDFGQLEAGCTSPTRELRVHNPTTTTAIISSVDIDPPHPAFLLSSLPALPWSIPPGGTVDFEVSATTAATSAFASAVRIQSTLANRTATHRVSLQASSAIGAVQEDFFDDVSNRPVDLLMVVDTSPQTRRARDQIVDGFSDFIRHADAFGVDYRIGITTNWVQEGARLVHPSNASDLFGAPRANRIISRTSSPSPEALYLQNLSLGTVADGPPRTALEMSYGALTSLNIGIRNSAIVRRDAALSVLFIDAQDDRSSRTTDFYVDFLRGTKDIHRRWGVSVSALAGPETTGCSGAEGTAGPSPRFAEVARRTGGGIEPICTSSWPNTTQSAGARAFLGMPKLPLTAPPVVISIEVRVDGAVLPQVTSDGTRHWRYDAPTNRVEFQPPSMPEPGSDVVIRYQAECL